MLPLIKPHKITVTDGDGNSHDVILSKFDAVEGMELQILYPTSLATSAIPKLGDYKISRELMYRIMNYVAVDINGQMIRLSTPQLINNHLGDWEALIKVIAEEMQYNNSFFRNGTISNFFAGITQTFLAKISEIYIQSLAQSSPTDSQHSPN